MPSILANISISLRPSTSFAVTYRACGINVRNRYATLSDNDLDTMVSSCTEQNRMIGCNSILAQLRASGVWVQRHRTARVDPIGVALRWSTSVQ